MAKTDFKSIGEYHAQFPPEVSGRLQAIREVIRETAPASEEVISYQIPAFRYGGAFLIYYSAYKSHISLSSPFSEAFLKEFEKELGGYKVSKSAIQFPDKEALPLELIRRMIAFRVAETLKKLPVAAMGFDRESME